MEMAEWMGGVAAVILVRVETIGLISHSEPI